jgi:hypothetical protein
MRIRSPRVFDASALVGLFHGHEELAKIADQAEQGWFQILLPAVAIADAEMELRAGRVGWDAVFYTPGLSSLDLTQSTAVEIGVWPGPLSARHAAHEAGAVRGVVVTRTPGAYQGLSVSLLVV